MPSQKTLYFAYGSNMNKAQVQARLGKHGPINDPVPANLNNAILVFDKYSRNRDCGAGNIVLSRSIKSTSHPQVKLKARNDLARGKKVEGLLFELNDAQLRELDFSEGTRRRRDGALSRAPKGYKRYKIKVRDNNGAERTAITYIANALVANGQVNTHKPTYDYVSDFLQNPDLTPPYRENLLKIEVKEGGRVRDYLPDSTPQNRNDTPQIEAQEDGIVKDNLPAARNGIINLDILEAALEELKNKADTLGENKRFESTATVASSLVNKIKTEINSLKRLSNPNEKNLNAFKTNINSLIETDSEALMKHKGARFYLRNIVLAVATLGIGYVVAGAIHKSRTGNFTFFNGNKTSSIVQSVKASSQSVVLVP